MEMLVVIALSSVFVFTVMFLLWGHARHRAATPAARLQRAIPRDAASGLANRQGFLEGGEQLLSRAGQRAAAIILIDVGPQAPVGKMGELAPSIAATLPGEMLVGMVQPTQFACIVMVDPYAPEAADQVAGRLALLLAQHDDSAARTATIGLARSDRDGGSIDRLLEAAGTAAGVARSDGIRSLWFTEEMAVRQRARNTIAHSLPEAIESGAIAPYFEPVIDLHTGELLGFEVLARWEHPVHGIITPAHFLDIAQESSAISDLTLSVMRQALLAARDWDGRLVLAVNFAVSQLRDPWLAQKVIRLLTELGYPPARLEIELTEGALMDPHGIAHSIIESLKAQGVRVALDDFGTGVSSLTHLRALPFDRIKIDHSIVTKVMEDPARASIAAAILRLGESLNLPIIAEGIETAQIADRMRAMGCAVGQGYLFGQPMSLMQTRRMLAERRMIPAVVTTRRLAG
ncbi:MAG: EAL domain-containing protein [Candidatus Sphingomonas colombiensis]|nr:EAL domain-containing response regulator [Sphingomonas sp.]WEK42818.1 MAG: EAL domain-containing protein [Sphingomonas sp.]